MMQKTQSVTLDRFGTRSNRLLKKAGAVKAVVFGSYARGDADAESDLDLMVILNTDLPFIERWDIIPGLRSRSPVQEMDLLAYTPGEVRRMMEKGSVLLPVVLEEGVTIYDGDPNFCRWWDQQAARVEKGEDVMKQNPEIVAQRWLRLARRDLISCSKVLEEGIFETVCFHAQQAAEKSLKTVAYLGGARRVMGHSCCRLVRQLQVQHPSLTVFKESAGLLDQVYTSSRYPTTSWKWLPTNYSLAARRKT